MKRAGYILIESLVAMSILSLGMISVGNALGQANYTRALARDRSDARFLLENLMGSIIIQPVVDTGTWQGTFRDHPRFSYEYTVRVASIPDPPAPPTQVRGTSEEFELPVSVIGHARAVVTWTRLGAQYTETFETLFSPDRLPEVQLEEFRFQQRRDRAQGNGSIGFSEPSNFGSSGSRFGGGLGNSGTGYGPGAY